MEGIFVEKVIMPRLVAANGLLVVADDKSISCGNLRTDSILDVSTGTGSARLDLNQDMSVSSMSLLNKKTHQSQHPLYENILFADVLACNLPHVARPDNLHLGFR